MGLGDHQKCLPTNTFCDYALQHPQTTLQVLKSVAVWMNRNFAYISISLSSSAISISQTFIAHVLLLLACCNSLQHCNCSYQPRRRFSQTDRIINYAISSFVNLYTQMNPLPAQHVIVSLEILISEQILVQLCCTELPDLKAKSSENRILHWPVNCTLNSSCSNLHFSLCFDYFFSPSTFAWVSTLTKD